MKKLLLLLLCAVFSFFALSEAENMDPFACDCGFDAEKGERCACFLQEGDIGPFVNGVIMKLSEREYLSFSHARGVFDKEVTDAIMRFQKDMDLDETGVVDDETLTALIFFGLPEILTENEGEKMLVFVPTDGGTHRHLEKTCSGMIAPRKISNRNAEALGIEMCEHCMAPYIPFKEAQYE